MLPTDETAKPGAPGASGPGRPGRTEPPGQQGGSGQPGRPNGALHAALRDGPFESALDTAIRASGLSMERIQRRLADRGVEVSITALSYWRRGRSRPERPQSRRAVRLLEELLALPTDSLVALLGPQRPRGRWTGRADTSLAPTRLWQGYQSLSGLLHDVGNTDDGLSRVAVHERFEIDAQGAESRWTACLVLRAERDDVDRCVVISRGDEPGRPLPDLVDVRNARPGRVRSDPDVPITVTELLLDRVLSKGETAVVEYTTAYPTSGRATDECGRGFRTPAALYTLEVTFHPDRVPVRCYRCAGTAATGSLPVVGPVWISPRGRAHMVVQDAAPGFHSLRWEWD
ncbi:hypothetical protein E4198_09000 [Streptomyces sp. RKND-216]|uniref:hypothetical protein n=1 Tax=Streptomyces sp. RKND-216 TaxID=2562581 RepID=UPI00109DA730|nr:hypothetical protein [Streptomyces sp. RKND-216]THA24847.1 hypothetical protein E4198_09000 [Streptomyces sp. RKND-216]